MPNHDSIPPWSGRNHVPGNGPTPCRVALIGEAPGEVENNLREPFVGNSGKELNRYLRSAGLFRSDIFISNLVKYWPDVAPNGKQLPPSKEDIARDETELLLELSIVQPEIIVAVGAHSARYFLGEHPSLEFRGRRQPRFQSMWREHGVPRIAQVNGRQFTIHPTVHPAAGLHNQVQEEQIRIQWDFEQLGKLLRGEIAAIPDEERNDYPQATYARLHDAENGPEILANILAGRTYVFLDTEGTVSNPWCVTVCVEPGVGYLIRSTERETLAVLNRHINAPHSSCTVGCHYLAHDIPVLEAMGIRIARHRDLRCTMLEAHLLGGMEPKGLKPLMWRLAGMEGESYEEVVAEAELKIVGKYLCKIFLEFVCQTCEGKGIVAEKCRTIDPNCTSCLGSGRVSSAKDCACVVAWGEPFADCSECLGTGQIATGRTKFCKCAKLIDKCPDCVDGIYVDRPDKEFVFDAAKGEFRWKQPHSLGKWLKRRLDKRSGESSESGEEPEEKADEAAIESESEDDADVASVAPFFKLRKDWDSLGQRNDKVQVEQLIGKMPWTTLSDVEDQDNVTIYACKDADAGFRISAPLERRLTDLGLLDARRIDARMIPMIARMEQVGVMIDREHFERFSVDLGRQMEEARDKLADLVGERNPNSRRLADVLFRQLHLPTVKLTKGGQQESLDDEVLETLKLQLHKKDDADSRLGIDVITCVQDYREFQKLKGTYVDVYLEKADRNDRVHTTIKYHQSMTRLTSEDPNLQNLGNPDNHPGGDDPIANTSLRLRNGIIAPPGYVLVDADFSSIELVVGAHLTQDRNLMRIFRDGLDPHRYAGTQLTGVPMDEIPKRVRTQCKKLNFSAFYDTSAPTLQRQFALMSPPIEMSEEECQTLIDWYFSDFAPDVMAWKQQTRTQARIDGYVKTMFGRLRWMPGLRSDIRRVKSAAERECTNAPIQGTARDILAIAMGDIWENVLPPMWAEGIDIQPVLTVHDALTFQVQEKHGMLAAVMIEAAMRDAVKFSVPIKVGVKVMTRWS